MKFGQWKSFLPPMISLFAPTTHAVLHLVTCYPFHYIGHAPKRMVIEASLEPNLVSNKATP